MAVTSATLSEFNTRLTVVFDTAPTSAISIILTGADAPASAPTFVSGSGTQRVYSFPEGALIGSNVLVASSDATTTTVRVTGFSDLGTNRIPINTRLLNYETFPLALVSDKELIDISLARASNYGSNAKKWSLRGTTLFSTTSEQKDYLTKFIVNKLYSNSTFRITLPREVAAYRGTNTSGSIVATSDLAAGANSVTMTILEADELPEGTLFNFFNDDKLYMVTSSDHTTGQVNFTPPVNTATDPRGAIEFRNPTIVCRVLGDEWSIEVPPGHTGDRSISFFARIVLDFEEV